MKKRNLEVRSSDKLVLQTSSAKWKSNNKQEGCVYYEGVTKPILAGDTYDGTDHTKSIPEVYVEPAELTALKALDLASESGSTKVMLEFLQKRFK